MDGEMEVKPSRNPALNALHIVYESTGKQPKGGQGRKCCPDLGRIGQCHRSGQNRSATCL